jgi:membrane protein DedA with SNARE-associated domain
MNEMLHSWLGHDGAALFIVVLLEQAGLPIPAAPCLLAAGSLCATGQATATHVIGLAILACLVVDVAWFYVGQRRGKAFLTFLGSLALLNNNGLERIERSFVRHGLSLVVISKFVPGLGMVVAPLAGALKVELGRFLLFDLLGSSLYAGIYLLAGIIFSEQVRAVLEMLPQLGLGALLVLAVLVMAYVVGKHTLRKTVLQPDLGAPVETQKLRRPFSTC